MTMSNDAQKRNQPQLMITTVWRKQTDFA